MPHWPESRIPEIVVPEAKAIVFFQAALLVCPRNYMAANDLGVLLARNGDNAGARRVLEHSVLICRTSENLNNLSVVYRQLGEQRLSALAAQKSQVAKASEIARQKSANLAAGGRPCNGLIRRPSPNRRASGPTPPGRRRRPARPAR